MSLLPDNPTASIDVMRGGGMIGGSFSEEELKILNDYGLGPGGRLDAEIGPEVKRQFLEQLTKSNCAIGTGDNVIINSECSAVAQVIRAMIRESISRTNGWTPRGLSVRNAQPPPPLGAQPPEPPAAASVAAQAAQELINTRGAVGQVLPPPIPVPSPIAAPVSIVDAVSEDMNSAEIESITNTVSENQQWINSILEMPSTTDAEKNEIKRIFDSQITEAIQAVETGLLSRTSPLENKLAEGEYTKLPKIIEIALNPNLYSNNDIQQLITSVNALYNSFKYSYFQRETREEKEKTLKVFQFIVKQLQLLYENMIGMNIMDELNNNATSVASENNQIPPAEPTNYPDDYYEDSPSNYQEGHLRINFSKPNNRRVFANARIGTRKTRIYGKNAANIKSKYNSKTRKLKANAEAAAARAAEATKKVAEAAQKARNAESLRRETEAAAKAATRSAAQKAANIKRAAEQKAKEEKLKIEREIKEARNAALARQAQERAEEIAAQKARKEAEKAERAAKIASGELKPSFFNRFRGGRKTHRKSRGGNKSRGANRR